MDGEGHPSPPGPPGLLPASDPSVGVPQFPLAPQPSIIRAQQKDEAYLQQLTEAVYDAVRRLLGPRRALIWGREIKALAELLYYSLTTGSGLQTLGEEYCDVVQAAGGRGGPPGALRRGTLVLLQALGPYFAETTLRSTTSSVPLALRGPPPPTNQPAASGLAAHWRSLRTVAAEGSASLKRQLIDVVSPRGVEYAAAARHFLIQHAPALLRLHLALFYLYGWYFQIPKRISGIRYLYLSHTQQSRPMYRVLGAVLLLQLGVTAAAAAVRSRPGSAPAWLAAAAKRRQDTSENFQIPRPAVLLDEEGKAVVLEPPAAEKSAEKESREVPAGRKCPLCLSQREVPTATPCGHVFCWTCIAEWAAQKPECPLCRAEAPPATLVAVRHADF